MKLKVLLLGSAATLISVSGARAADAVVIPEPEAVEYVRVCDAAGAGYFYIPGGETCIKFGGYVRYDVGFGDTNGVTSETGDETWNKRARASFRVSTYTDTDLGALESYVETRWQWDTNDTDDGYTNDSEFSINFAYINLAGLRIGKSESLFTTFTDYAGGVINDDIGGGYGPFDTNLISYTVETGGFTAALSLEQGDDDDGWGIEDYVPHVVGGLGYELGPVALTGVVGYDSANEGFAAKIRGDIGITDNASLFAMVLWTDEDSAYGTWRTGDDDTLSVIGGGSYVLTEKLTTNAQVQWSEGNGADDIWAVSANVAYEMVPGFTITPEAVWISGTRDDDTNLSDEDDAFGGVIRFQRSF